MSRIGFRGLQPGNKGGNREGSYCQVSHGDHDLQAKCSKDAKTFFTEGWTRDKDPVLLDYSNHYNKAQNKCFIYVEYHFHTGTDASWTNDIFLWDV
jgi:hypothetical protein